MSESFFANVSSFSNQQVFIPKFLACSKLWAISSIKIDWFGLISNFFINFSYGSKWGFGVKLASTISKAPSNKPSIPNCLVTFSTCACEPLVNIIFFALILISSYRNFNSFGNLIISISWTNSRKSCGSIPSCFINPDKVVPYS